LLRKLFGESGRVAQWTRQWHCRWRVSFAPLGGSTHLLDKAGRPFEDRAEALACEAEILAAWMATGAWPRGN